MTAEVDVAIPWGDASLAGLWCVPRGARWLYVFGHGAGAGMRHPFMHEMAQALAARGVATLRWEQPAMSAGKSRPDPSPKVETMARAACVFARAAKKKLRLVAGGKSMGGRMTSLAASKEALPGVEALVFLGFPLHPPDKPGSERAAHLAAIDLPLLFVSGTRDALATLALLRAAVAPLPRTTLVEIDQADHGLARPKRAGPAALGIAADAVAAFLQTID